MKIPSSLSFLRGPLHKFRSLFLAFLGLRQYHLPSGGDTNQSVYLNMIQMLADRVAVLESLLNWRLYGMPAKIHNIKLEQMQFLSGSGDVEACIGKLKDVNSTETSSSFFVEFIQDALEYKMCLFLDYQELSQLPKEYFEYKKQKTTFIFDSDNLFKYNETLIASLKKFHEALHVGIQSAMGRLGQSEFNVIWLSSFCERLTPIQFTILLMRSKNALLSPVEGNRSECCGVYKDYGKNDAGDYWRDPRRLRPITKSYITTIAAVAGFKDVQFKDLEDDGQTLFILSK